VTPSTNNTPSHEEIGVLTNADIITLFDRTHFGNIDGDVQAQRKFLARACLKTLTGYWNGHTIFRIMCNAGLVTDEKHPTLTPHGKRFVYNTFK
jgi:hypothetical protein